MPVSTSTSSTSTTVRVRVKRVSNYITGKSLGTGTFGDVRLATHLITGEKVALKILDKSRIQCEDDFKRIVREIQVLKLLDHPHIVRLLEVIDTPRHIYLVTEFVDNGELFNYVVQKQRLAEPEACRFFHQIVSGLAYCHSRKVCHRDMKLENVLLDSSYNIKLIDFGLSNILMSDETRFKTACGSPSYASPEMLSGRKYHGPSVDVWAAGIILYAMLCGYLPFDHDNTESLYKKIIAGVFQIPSHVSPPAADLLRKILVVNPDKRYTIADILQHPWFVESYVGPEPAPSPRSLLESPSQRVIDFRIIYTMVTKVSDWTALRIIKALNGNRHNQMTATYYLLCERDAQTNGHQWNFDEQRRYAAALNLELGADGRLAERAAGAGEEVDLIEDSQSDPELHTLLRVHEEETQSEHRT
ncbi:Kinase, CAMK CAMKL [Giardia muris]|uniref:non-specific serine/threonine protein kinase n=1 Tax=Giardia muris TaxID=5742 RepID=A0A4Z1SXD8_GIAMU|nr:Kinase, CAMK CAMKL [Giardia muris]|eukprot:TNJ30452.1 Kinase, CAMK CAMKL [Giardia muris]